MTDAGKRALPLLCGLVVGAAGLAWILTAFTRRPAWDAWYHVPLAVVFTGAVVDAWLQRRVRPARGFLWITALVSVVVVARIARDWPFSGHGLLGGLLGLEARRTGWRLAALATAGQALAMKIVIDDRPWCVPLGLAVGIAAAFVSRALDRPRA